MRKLLAVGSLMVLLVAGASAQIMLGVTGALPMDQQMDVNAIQNAFKTGENIWVGVNAELALGRLGFGLNVNLAPVPIDTGLGYFTQDMDANAYLAWHFWKAKSFLDPFVRLGGGYIGTDYAFDSASQQVKTASFTPEDPLSASLYWFAAAGLGVNLGPIGVFAEFAYNNAVLQHLTGKDVNGTEYEIPYYGPWNDFKMAFDQYVPALRFTVGAKFIL